MPSIRFVVTSPRTYSPMLWFTLEWLRRSGRTWPNDRDFGAGYASVERFVAKLRTEAPRDDAHPVTATAPGEEGQVYGDGPMVRHPGGGSTAARAIGSTLRGRGNHGATLAAMEAKRAVRDLLEKLPDDCSQGDVLYPLYVLQRVGQGLAEADAGDVVPHQEVERELRRRWLLGDA